jgi:hypothetical protein
MTRGAHLALRRRLLVASATLQRARLAQEWHDLGDALRPGPRSTAAVLAAGLVALVLLRPRGDIAARRASAPQAPIGAPWWLSAALTLWRLARVLLRQRAAEAPPR